MFSIMYRVAGFVVQSIRITGNEKKNILLLNREAEKDVFYNVPSCRMCCPINENC